MNLDSSVNEIIVMETVPIRFGPGAVEEIGYELQRRRLLHVALVTDPHLRRIGLVDRMETSIRETGVTVEVFDQVRAEPTDRSVEAALEWQQGRAIEGYVAFGGGSSIDTAKAMNLYGTYPAPLLEYVNKPVGNGRPVPGPLKPLVAVPTTAGTGSESTSVLILDMVDLHLKTGVSHPYIRPSVGIVDPLLTFTMPPVVTASCGLDVLCHALESYVSLSYDARPRPASPAERPPYIGANPIADLFSVRAVALTGAFLRRAYFNPYDREARTQMMLAATLAGFGFGNAGVHIPHAMGYPVAGMVRDFRAAGYPDVSRPQVPHGMSCIVNAPAAFRYTLPAQPERHAHAARLLGADDIPTALIRLMQDLDMPNGLQALGYTEDDIPALTVGAMKQQRLLVNAPRPVTETDMRRIFQDAMRYW
ncbi:MAG: iron-containing alcohol dehydrogenase [candidate division Zixibacteria bacterium]|nr:iron-containing alcohol dehydrogenase [candidate division Zixibacteria bacterium]